VQEELEWVNEIALSHQKNYQIWHHRQLLVDNLYPKVEGDETKKKELEESEREFMTAMFDQDAKNYHVWSYRQYLVRKLGMWNDQELKSIEALLREDVRNNSAWSHRFFLVFSDPKHSTPDSRATAHDPAIRSSIIDRELSFAQAATYEAPQNQSPWNYIRGVLRKGGRPLSSLESFATEFVDLKGQGGGEVVRSSHALDFLADAWSEQGKTEEASRALRLLGDRYDRVRKNYWEWKRKQLGASGDVNNAEAKGKGAEEIETGVEGLDVKA
jgi:protein farnesyltransferase/geranylgeranyltransferase type-1 subunit alpha